MLKKNFIGIILFILVYNLNFAQNFSGGYNFNIPPFDSTTQNYLPKFPIIPILSNSFMTINGDGNFSVNGERIKFWGMNLTSDACFPNKTLADDIASKIRKIGFNLVRFHHMDNPWAQGSFFYQTPNTRTLNVANLDKFEYLFSKLKNNGIYSNINLHVSRTFKVSDGIPDANTFPEFGKAVTIFDRQLINLQKEFASQLLTHINPYTGLSLVNDPAMAMVEITNENSLLRFWRDGNLKTTANGGVLNQRHSNMLDSLWIDYLKNKYITTTNLSTAWNQGELLAGNNQILNSDFESLPITSYWGLEFHNGTTATMTKDIINPFAGLLSAKIVVTNTTGTFWHLQWFQKFLTAIKDTGYVLEFAARSDGNKKISISFIKQDSPYTYYAGNEYNLTTNWQVFSYNFSTFEDAINQLKLSFQFNENGIYWFDNIKLYKTPKHGLLPNESLENKNVKRNDYSELKGFTVNRVKDNSEFYITLTDNYFAEMKVYLKNTLNVKVPIVGSNWNIGNLDLISHSKLDYLDNHAYWDHPSFPNQPWSSTDWLINNQSMTKFSENSTINSLFSGTKYKGKPYTISEYNHPFPNRYQCEAPIFLSAYSSFHNADAIMLFDYNSSQEWVADKVDSYFSIHRNPVYMALNPTVAYLFRNSIISESKNKVSLNYSRDHILNTPIIDNGGWNGVVNFDNRLAFIHGIETESFNSSVPTNFDVFPTFNQSEFLTDTEEISLNTSGLLTVKTPKIIAATGYLNNYSGLSLGNLTINSVSDFSTLSWLSLSSDSLTISNKSLLTLVSKVQNTGMIWNGTTTINNNWGTSPTLLSPVVANITFSISADSIYIYPLSTKGQEDDNNKIIVYPNDNDDFITTIDQSILNTPWFGIFAFIKGATDVTQNNTELINYNYLENNYPNPFNSSTKITFNIIQKGVIKLEVYDILGRKIKTLADSYFDKGKYSYIWNGDNNDKGIISGGIYFIKLTTPFYSKTIKTILLK